MKKKKNFTPAQQKITHNLVKKILLASTNNKTLPVIGYQVFTDPRGAFGPLLLSFVGCCWATLIFNSLHRFSKGLSFGDLLGHSITLMYLPLLSHSLCRISRVLWVIFMLENPSTTNLQCPVQGKEFSRKISPSISLLTGVVVMSS